MKSGNTTTKGRNFISKIQDLFNHFNDSPTDHAPMIENLEPRVLLSGNPLYDIMPDSQAVIVQSRIPGPNTCGTQSENVDPRVEVTYSSHIFRGIVNIDLSYIAGPQPFMEWQVNILDGNLNYPLTTMGSSANTSLRFDCGFLKDGTYVLQVIAKDASGGVSSYNHEIIVANADVPKYEAAPQVEISYPSQVFKGTADIGLEFTPGTLPFGKWEANIVNATTGEKLVSLGAGSTAEPATVAFDTSVLANGAYKLQVITEDESGRSSSYTHRIEVRNTKPIYYVDFAGPKVKGTIDVNLSVVSGTRPLAEWKMNVCDYETGEIIATIASGTSYGESTISFDSTLFEDGSYWLQVDVKDVAGEGQCAHSQLFIDNNAPIAVITSPTYGADVYGHVVVKGRIYDSYDSTGSPYFLNWNLDLVNTETGEKFSLAKNYWGPRDPSRWDALAMFEPLMYPPGSYELVLTVTDFAGYVTIATSALTIVEPPIVPGYTPEVNVTHNAESTMTVGQKVDVIVTTPGGYRHMWLMVNGKKVEVDGQGRASIELTETGSYEVIAYVTGYSKEVGRESFSFEVIAADNEDPVVTITHNAPPTIRPGQTVDFAVKADDNVGVDSLQFTINGKEVTIDDDGKAQYIFAEAGSYEILAVAIDAAGNRGTKSFRFEVVALADTEDPVVDITHNAPSTMYPGQRVDFVIRADDNDVVDRIEMTINGDKVEISEDGRVSYTFDQIGFYEIKVIATDRTGNVGHKTITLYAADPTDRTAPVITWNVTQNQYINGLFSVTGSVYDPNSEAVFWTLSLKNSTTGEEFTVATGSGEITNGVIAGVDPSVVANGSYVMTLRAVDGAGNASTKSQTVTMHSDYKLGSFDLSFVDMNVSVGGIPISIIRSYDTNKAGVSGDFGYGWSMTSMPVKLDNGTGVDLSKNPGLEYDMSAALTNGSRISVTMPNGKTQIFTVNAVSSGWFGYRLQFRAVGGNGETLTLTGDPVVSMDQYGRFHSSNFPFNPGSSFTRQDFVLTTSDGLRYIIDGRTSRCKEVTAPDGNRLLVADNSLKSYSKNGTLIAEVVIERERSGRITRIVGPNETAAYEYDAKGDLVAVTTETNGRLELSYLTENGAPNHYLKSITDDRGVDVLNLEYDYATGRINRMTGADGNSIGISFTTQIAPGINVESVTNGMNQTEETVINANGNILRTIKHISDPDDPSKLSYLIVIEEFDAKGNSTGKASPFTVTAEELKALGTNQYEYVPADLVWQSQTQYDAKGNVTQTTDAFGQVTNYKYDSRGNVTETTDALGRKTKNEYDSSGRLRKTTDANGTVSIYTYDTLGNVTAIKQIQPDGTEVNQGEMTYNAQNKIERMTDDLGFTTSFEYDAKGRQTLSRVDMEDPDVPGLFHSIVSLTEYNDQGKVTKTWQEIDGVVTNVTEYTYTAGNLVETQTDTYGNTTHSVYDVMGRVIEQRQKLTGEDGSTLWLVSRTVYNLAGQVVWSQGAHVEANSDAPQAAKATYTVYDDLGREVRTEVRDGVIIVVTGTGVRLQTEVTDTGSVVSHTATGYDAAGRQAWTENTHGVKTVYHYNANGTLSHTSIDWDGDLTTTDDQYVISGVEYDQYGRQTASILDRDGDLSTTHDQIVTRYAYDSMGRLVETTYSDNSTVRVEYDAVGRKIRETDQLGQTTQYEYDSHGRLTAAVLPKVKHPITGNMVHVRYEYRYDANGNQISLRDNIFQIDAANASTIDRTGMRETTYTYNWMGKQTSRTLPDGLTEYFHYDEQGRQTRHVSFEGRVTYETYDSRDRVSGRYFYDSEASWNDGAGTPSRSITYEYDIQGRVIREVDSANGTTETAYDSSGRVARLSTVQGIVNYEYDPVTGQVSRTWTGDDGSDPITDTRYTYDALGRLETVEAFAREGQSLLQPEVAKYVYDLVGNLDKIFHSNGIITDYNYDTLNRLSEVVHTHDNGTPDDTSDDVLVEKFAYTYHANGNKSSETATDQGGNSNVWEWDYDALGRLIQERHDNHDDSLDYETGYAFDLVGNRLEKVTNANGSEEKVTYRYDANDRLLNERRVLDNIGVEETAYGYNGSEQIRKTVTDLLTSQVNAVTKMEYNDQDRLARIVIETYVNGTMIKKVTQDYVYDSSGVKVSQTETVDADADGIVDSTKTTNYLIDKQNHTGYSQVLEERVSENGGAESVTTYTIGHDILAQYNALNGFLALLADGHGSTRAVADNHGNIVQEYNYDAYGNAHGFDASQALTNLLYSGEQFNPVSGLQYLRARWYNPQTGTFNRLDPYSGDTFSPTSYNKYSYCVGNPVNMIDPSGEVSLTFIALMVSKFVHGLGRGMEIGDAIINAHAAWCLGEVVKNINIIMWDENLDLFEKLIFRTQIMSVVMPQLESWIEKAMKSKSTVIGKVNNMFEQALIKGIGFAVSAVAIAVVGPKYDIKRSMWKRAKSALSSWLEPETDNLEAMQKGMINGYRNMFLHASDASYQDLLDMASRNFARHADDAELSYKIFKDILDKVQDLIVYGVQR